MLIRFAALAIPNETLISLSTEHEAQLTQFSDECRHTVSLLDAQAVYTLKNIRYPQQTTGNSQGLRDIRTVSKIPFEL